MHKYYSSVLNLGVDIRIQKLLLVVLLLTTLVVTPGNSLDAVNLPKLLVLATLSFTILAILLSVWSEVSESIGFTPILIVIFIFLAMLSSFLIAGPSTKQIFGAFGRSTGLLTFASFLSIFLASVVVGHKKFGLKLLAILLIVATLNAFYGFLQSRGLDPIDWQGSYGPVFGTLGNPNFLSAFLGLGAVSTFAFVLGAKKLQIKLLLNIPLLMMLYVLFETDSIQGLVIFLSSSILLIYLKFIRPLLTVWRVSYFSLTTLFGSIGIFGFLDKGPLSNILSGNSLLVRTYYWEAAWNMSLKNPFNGVGIDGYGDFYRAARSPEAASTFGSGLITDSAHNYFLDIAAYGGFPLLIAYFLLNGLIIKSAIHLLKSEVRFDLVGAGLVSCWMAFFVQSLISVNQIGVAIWGWVLGGAIIGYDRFLSQEREFGKDKRESIEASLSPRVVLSTFLGFLIGLGISVWPFQKDVEFASALETRNAITIQNAALQWPRDSFYTAYASEIFVSNELYRPALQLARVAVQQNPRDYFAWQLILNNPISSEAQKNHALDRMRILDPWNSDIRSKD